MNGHGDIWGLVWQEQVDFGGCPTVSMKALGRLINLPQKGKGESKGVRRSGKSTPWEGLNCWAERCFLLRQTWG